MFAQNEQYLRVLAEFYCKQSCVYAVLLYNMHEGEDVLSWVRPNCGGVDYLQLSSCIPLLQVDPQGLRTCTFYWYLFYHVGIRAAVGEDGISTAAVSTTASRCLPQDCCR